MRVKPRSLAVYLFLIISWILYLLIFVAWLPGQSAPNVSDQSTFDSKVLPDQNIEIKSTGEQIQKKSGDKQIIRNDPKYGKAREDHTDCPMVKLDGLLEFHMCIFSYTEDFFISGHVRGTNTLYESDYVHKMLEIVGKDKDMGLIDIGANIGTYSLPFALSGHPVVSIEPLQRAMNLFKKSIKLGNPSGTVTCLNAALSDARGTLYVSENHSNQGGSRVVSKDECDGWHEQYYCDRNSNVTAIALDDLLPVVTFRKAVMKVDVEGSEWRIFREPCRLFDEVDIPYVQMEWMWYLPGKGKVSGEEITSLVKFFNKRNYSPYSLDGDLLSLFKWEEWPGDIVWKKS